MRTPEQTDASPLEVSLPRGYVPCERVRVEKLFDRHRRKAIGVRLGPMPMRLVVAQRPTRLGHPRSPRHPVVGLPAVRGFDLLLGDGVSRQRDAYLSDTAPRSLRMFCPSV